MLTRLTISNYALIDILSVDFHPKLNTITGETGAGKSIILGALALILGSRADMSVLKDKSKKCIVEGFFEIEDYNLAGFFSENDLDYSATTILRREITVTGNSRAFINDTPVTLKIMRDLGLLLIDIHSQHQNLELGTRKFQLDLVDMVSGSQKQLKHYRELYNHFVHLQKELFELIAKHEKEKSEFDYWQFQFNQLSEAQLKENEQEELEALFEQLSHAEEIKNALAEVKRLIDDERFSVLLNLKESSKQLGKIDGFLPASAILAERLDSCMLELKDILDETENLLDGVEHDPSQMDKINNRLNLIYSLQQKHHLKTVAELIELRDVFEGKIARVTGYDIEIEAFNKQLNETRSKLEKSAKELSSARNKAFGVIESEVIADLQQLGMAKAKLEVKHELLPEFTINGTDAISILFSANPDAATDEISKVASGGEMSRLMLAIKNLLRKSKALPTVIFDEIDSGVSGEIALKMGNIIKSFSTSTQIINITHLPQVAAKGDAHLLVYKFEGNGKTFTSIKHLDENERIVELAKMVGGENFSDAALKTAQELLEA